MIYIHTIEFASGKRKSYAKVITSPIESLKDGQFLREGENLIDEISLIVHVVPTGSAKNGTERLDLMNSTGEVIYSVDDWTKKYHSTIEVINKCLSLLTN